MRRQKKTVPQWWKPVNTFSSIILIHSSIAAFALRLRRASSGFLICETEWIPPCEVEKLLVSLTALAVTGSLIAVSMLVLLQLSSWFIFVFIWPWLLQKRVGLFVEDDHECLICSSTVLWELLLMGSPGKKASETSQTFVHSYEIHFLYLSEDNLTSLSLNELSGAWEKWACECFMRGAYYTDIWCLGQSGLRHHGVATANAFFFCAFSFSPSSMTGFAR